MKDINTPLEKAYFTALQDIGVPVYNQELPDNVSPESYILFRSINSNDNSSKSFAKTSTTITVEIHTFKDKINQSVTGNTLAEMVMERIYPYRQFVLPLDGMQMVSTELANDASQNYSQRNQRTYLSRYITFRHSIFMS